MQTHFTPARLNEPKIAEANAILRTCVHCGFCLPTCPTYVLLGDERDSPRGRIYLIKDMLEKDRPATSDVAIHIDRCLSCLACMTACPSGVDYMHLIDQARVHVEATYRRPLGDRLLRAVLAWTLPEPWRFRLALRFARLGRAVGRVVTLPAGLRAMLDLAPHVLPPREPLQDAGVHRAQGQRRGRVALLTGCAQRVIAPEINAATVRLLTRIGFDVVVADGSGCCGSLTHHMGKEADAKMRARANILAWSREADGDGLDAILINASGCGTTVKDYGHMFAGDPELAAKAGRIASLARDVCEFLAGVDFAAAAPEKLRVAYHAACALQHGQRITHEPRALLARSGFEVLDVPEGHLCCGSAGTYNILQPEIAAELRSRKVANIESTRPDVIATGNIGCITQIASGTRVPAVHTVALLDWASGGPKPF